MPSKQSLLDNHETARSILLYAAANHGVSMKLKFIKHEISGQVRIGACTNAAPQVTFEGIGVDKREALADCISGEFPS